MRNSLSGGSDKVGYGIRFEASRVLLKEKGWRHLFKFNRHFGKGFKKNENFACNSNYLPSWIATLIYRYIAWHVTVAPPLCSFSKLRAFSSTWLSNSTLSKTAFSVRLARLPTLQLAASSPIQVSAVEWTFFSPEERNSLPRGWLFMIVIHTSCRSESNNY